MVKQDEVKKSIHVLTQRIYKTNTHNFGHLLPGSQELLM